MSIPEFRRNFSKNLQVGLYALGTALLVFAIRYLSGTASWQVFLGVWLGATLFIYGMEKITVIVCRDTRTFVSVAIFGLITGVALMAISSFKLMGWVGLLFYFGGLLLFQMIVIFQKNRTATILGSVVLMTVAGFVPVGIMEILAKFADEEFFTALQMLVLIVIWVTLWFAVFVFVSKNKLIKSKLIQRVQLNSTVIILGAGVLLCLFAIILVRQYETSFFQKNVSAPFYGLSKDEPYLCSSAVSSPATNGLNSATVFENIVQLVKANPNKTTAEYGFLALATKKNIWVNKFKTQIMHEAATGAFTHPANSLKSIQYDAAFRVWYYYRIQEAFPDLFSKAESKQLVHWFSEINKRALRTEWIDWMYGLAFSKIPAGPYENQEVGAGLLALLETNNSVSGNLSVKNQTYLRTSIRGWSNHFRNVDDAIIYQPQWINNAYFQSIYRNERNYLQNRNVEKSFDWMLLQSFPDGATLEYNYPLEFPLAASLYFGARLVEKPEYIWLAGRITEWLIDHNGYLYAQPGLETPLNVSPKRPDVGSCLIYGDSGLPNQLGPLAPDKIVFREGWNTSDAYLLLNLRFSGWHRYKATNTITTVYKGKPLISEASSTDTIAWLPVGRSIVRDKRIPRENTNGFLVEPSGIQAVINQLSVGSRWAQDPQQYAIVEDFVTSPSVDWSHTQLTDWHGWQHDRFIYFYHNNAPIIVWDNASGRKASNVAINWHIAGDVAQSGNRFKWDDMAEMVLVPTNQSEKTAITGKPDIKITENLVAVKGNNTKNLEIATVFLFDDWVGAEISYNLEMKTMQITAPNGQNMISIHLGEKP